MTLNMIYAGIGSTETPPEVLTLMRYLGANLFYKGFTLRSGGAIGADRAFQEGASMCGWGAAEKMQIYTAADAKPAWFHHARQFHPAWRLCSESAKAKHARNSAIILGPSLLDPVDFIVCWTRDGRATGGTGQGLRIADHARIPVYNLYDATAAPRLLAWLKEQGFKG